ncbi:MAG: glycosyltransferase [Candidatus Cloacimonetes bacterium]|nr:glycosyltransferase [Candidatus Cloacimonadota bacterium]
MRKLLYFSYFFPPMGGVAGLRALKFVKYLPHYNWQPHVISVKRIAAPAYDDSLREQISGSAVFYTEAFTPMRFLYLFDRASSLLSSSRSNYLRASEKKRFFWRNIFPIDSKIGWIPFAVHKSMTLGKKFEFSAVIATIPPYSAAVAAYRTAKKLSLPLIVDYRDLWQGNSEIPYSCQWLRKYSYEWEKKILSYAAAVIMATRSIRDQIMSFYPDIDDSKFYYIPNGWDSEDFQGLQSRCTSEISFTFIGSLSGEIVPHSFMKALQEMEAEGRLPNVKFRFIGSFSDEIKEILQVNNLVDRVEVLSHQPHRQALEYMLGSTFLLLFLPRLRAGFAIPAKVFEYLAARRPILAMIPENSEAAAILKENKVALLADFNDIPAIKENIYTAITLAKQGNIDREFSLQDNLINQFERKNLTRELGSILDKIIDEN